MRPLACLTFLALTSTAIGAQQPGSQPTGNPIVQSFTSTLPYGRWLIEAFDSIPESKYGYKPTPVQQTVGYIAQHLEDANYQLCARMSGVKHPLTAKDSLADTVKAKWPKDTLTARLKASLYFCRDVIANVTDASLADTIMTVGPPNARRTAYRARYFVLFVTDLAEHYAQIAGYMRQLGMIPPSAQPPPGR
jgi:uncharacterized damage-inducible protein DinB